MAGISKSVVAAFAEDSVLAEVVAEVATRRSVANCMLLRLIGDAPAAAGWACMTAVVLAAEKGANSAGNSCAPGLALVSISMAAARLGHELRGSLRLSFVDELNFQFKGS